MQVPLFICKISRSVLQPEEVKGIREVRNLLMGPML